MRISNFQRRIVLALAAALAAPAAVASARAYSETVLYSFKGGSDGELPSSGLIADRAGTLFGTTYFGGGGACNKTKGCGTVYSLAPDGAETVLYAFKDYEDGAHPNGNLIEDGQGNLYGTTSGGGNPPCKCGTVFELTPGGIHTVLYYFQGGSDGETPFAGLVADRAGNLYGTTLDGDAGGCQCGTVYEVTPAGVHSVLHSFQGGSDGWGPQAPLVFDIAGNLIGTTGNGGDARCNCGTVFSLAPDGSETVLHAFSGKRDGAGPSGGLIVDGAGDFYGTTGAGGGKGCDEGFGCGTVFRLASDGSTEAILSKFNATGGPEGPGGGGVMDGKGNLFGTAAGGAAGCGTVFKIAPGGKAKAIYSFACGNDGGDPQAGLLQGPHGNLYGTTTGANGPGTIFVVGK